VKYVLPVMSLEHALNVMIITLTFYSIIYVSLVIIKSTEM